MRRLVIMSFPMLVCFAACAGGDRRNTNCEWPPETAISLDLRNPRHQQHLSDDALLAEDLAIRYADVHRGLRTGHYAGTVVYEQMRDGCMAALFSTIAKNHAVTLEQVRECLLRRRVSFDAMVLLSFAAIYCFVAASIARRVCRRFPLQESAPAALAFTTVTSASVSFAGALLGELWSFIAEGIRLGNNHLSYRASRIPWVQHRWQFFAICFLLYWLVAALRYADATVRGGIPNPRRSG